MDTVKSIAKNTVAPLGRNTNTAIGFSIDTFLEATISWLIRYLIGDRVPFFSLMVTVALSAPLIGLGSVMGTKFTGADTDMSVKFLKGLQTVPSLFVAQYVLGTVNRGFYAPSISIWHVLITTIARTMSRVIISYANDKGFLPGKAQWEEYIGLQSDQLNGGTFSR